MQEVTFDEAATCPRCKNRMEDSFVRKVDKNNDLYEAICRTPNCPWEGTGKLIQMTDGKVFLRQMGARGMDKSFPQMTNDALSRGQRLVEDVKGEDLRDKNK